MAGSVVHPAGSNSHFLAFFDAPRADLEKIHPSPAPASTDVLCPEFMALSPTTTMRRSPNLALTSARMGANVTQSGTFPSNSL